MVDRPIIFSGPMVSALLAGRKSQTRRVLKPQPVPCLSWSAPPAGTYPSDKGWSRLPYATGDRLYVREAVCWVSRLGWRYRADDDDLSDKREAGEVGRWHPSIHMPRLASRITLTVTDVRVQRLQEISEDDAVAEGVEDVTREVAPSDPDLRFWRRYRDGGWNGYVDTSTGSYASLWTELHGPGAWEANPWVAAYSFTVQRGNIDAPKETSND